MIHSRADKPPITVAGGLTAPPDRRRPLSTTAPVPSPVQGAVFDSAIAAGGIAEPLQQLLQQQPGAQTLVTPKTPWTRRQPMRL